MDYLVAEITEVAFPAPGCALIRFAGPRPVTGEPGQFVMVRGDFGTDPILPRAFSLVEASGEGAILVRAIGKATRRLIALRPGDKLSVLGPLGRGFNGPEHGRRPVLVAGGMGVAPLLFFAERLAAGAEPPIFLYGARTGAEFNLLRRLDKASRLVLATEDGSRGQKGLVTDLLGQIVSDDGPLQLYACGPEAMLRAVSLAAGKSGIPCQIALESPMACGIGTCKGCAVEGHDGGYRYVCSDGPVFEAQEIFGGAR